MENEWFQTLVIILSAMLALFLLLSIVLIAKVIQIVKQIKKIVDQAEETVEKAEHVANFFKSTATPVAILKLIANISDAVSKGAKKAKKR
jgi:predicted PurR-regulated permease PerM